MSLHRRVALLNVRCCSLHDSAEENIYTYNIAFYIIFSRIVLNLITVIGLNRAVIDL